MLLGHLWLACLAFALLVQALLRRDRGETAWRYAIPVGWFFFPIVASMLGSFITPMFVIRYLSVTVPGLVLLIAIGIWELRRPLGIGAASLVIIIASVAGLRAWYSDPPLLKDRPWRAASEFILEGVSEGDALLFDGSASAVPFSYYRSQFEGDQPDIFIPYLPPALGDGIASTSLRGGLDLFAQKGWISQPGQAPLSAFAGVL